MENNLQNLLLKSGLTEKETTLYLLLRKYKQASIPELVYRSKLPNVTVYRTLKDLEEKKLIESIALNKKQSLYFPKSLVSITKQVQKQQRDLRKVELALLEVETCASHSESNSTFEQISIREGQEAFREEFLKLPADCTDEYLHIGSVDGLWLASGYTYESPEIRYFVNERMHKNIFAREITLQSEEAERIQKNDSREKRTTRLQDAIPVENNMLVITDSQVAHFICNPDSPRVITIRDPDLVHLHKEHFASLWK